jgi:hypothetical protein
MVLVMEYDILHLSIFGFCSLCGVLKHKMFRDGSVSLLGNKGG